jgi:hypothetical protein
VREAPRLGVSHPAGEGSNTAETINTKLTKQHLRPLSIKPRKTKQKTQTASRCSSSTAATRAPKRRARRSTISWSACARRGRAWRRASARCGETTITTRRFCIVLFRLPASIRFDD